MDRRGPRRGRGGDPGRSRAQSTVIGVALLLALTIGSATVILAVGSPVLEGFQESARTQQVESSLAQLDSKAAQVALGRSPVQTMSLGTARTGDQLAVEERGWIRVRILNGTTGAVETQVLNQTLGAVTYETAGGSIAYQGGGVWKRGAGGSTMISAPEVHYRSATLTLPVIVVDGSGTLSDGVRIAENGTVTRKYPTGTNANPVDEGLVNVTIHSAYYEAWGRYFEERTEGRVAYDHGANAITVTLAVPFEHVTLDSAMAATRDGGSLVIDGTAGPGEVYTDSYNSSIGSYATQPPGTDGNITYAGDITVTGAAKVEGNLRSGKAITLAPGAGNYVNGTLYYTTGYSDPDGDANGYVEIDGIADAHAIDVEVADRVAAIEASHDNAAAGGTIGDIESGDCASGCTLDAGRYALDRIDLSPDDELVLDTTDGDVTLAVREYVHLPDTSGGPPFDPARTKLTVQGDGVVEIYVDAGGGIGTGCRYAACELVVGKNAGVHVPDDDAPRLRVFATKDFNATIEGAGPNAATFVGILYAPAGDDGRGSVFVKHADVYGGVVTGTARIETMGRLHYDRALSGMTLVDGEKRVAEISFLHVTVNRLNVSSI